MKRLGNQICIGLLTLLGLLSEPIHAQPNVSSAPVQLTWPNYQLKAQLIAADTWLLPGAVEDFTRANGCNIINTILLRTQQGWIVVNTGPSYLYGQQQRQVLQSLDGIAKGTPIQVWNLNLHPDYFLGNQAYADSSIAASVKTIAGQQREGGAYVDNLFRLCGDWMKDTESTPAKNTLRIGQQNLQGRAQANHQLELLQLSGHTADDVVVLDASTGVVLAGGLVFTARAPTTPHADIKQWLKSLDMLEARLKTFPLKALVPSHGPVRADTQGIADTRYYLTWLDQRFTQAAQQGMDLAEVVAMPLPPEIARYAAVKNEYLRNVTHLYPQYEKNALR